MPPEQCTTFCSKCSSSRWRTSPTSAISCRRPNSPADASAAVVGAGLLLFLFAGIVPRVASSVERTGVALYGTVIAAMLLSVLFYRGRYAPGFRVAALFFVFSDATIAWNKFVEPLPDATLRIMSTYYAAQYLFALLALAASSRKAAAARP